MDLGVWIIQIWIFGTLLVVATFLSLTIMALGAAICKRRKGFVGLSAVFFVGFLLAILANPICNFFVSMFIYESRVFAMYQTLQEESFTGRTKAELLTHFGPPDRIDQRSQSELYRYDCRPWYVTEWSEINIEIQNDKITRFWIED